MALAKRLKIENDRLFFRKIANGGLAASNSSWLELATRGTNTFTGNQSFYQNTDLRYSFSSMKTKLIPIRVGIYSGFDYGRIWLNEEDSKKWHNSYGGGFFINGAELLSANIGLFNSSDGMRAAFSLGFQF